MRNVTLHGFFVPQMPGEYLLWLELIDDGFQYLSPTFHGILKRGENDYKLLVETNIKRKRVLLPGKNFYCEIRTVNCAFRGVLKQVNWILFAMQTLHNDAVIKLVQKFLFQL